MYSFTMSRATKYTPGLNYKSQMRHKNVAKGILRSQIRQFKHEDYLRMYNGGALTNVVNRRIGSKLHQVRLSIWYYTWI